MKRPVNAYQAWGWHFRLGCLLSRLLAESMASDGFTLPEPTFLPSLNPEQFLLLEVYLLLKSWASSGMRPAVSCRQANVSGCWPAWPSLSSTEATMMDKHPWQFDQLSSRSHKIRAPRNKWPFHYNKMSDSLHRCHPRQ